MIPVRTTSIAIFTAVIVCLMSFTSSYSYAVEKEDITVDLIGSSFKALGKIYVYQADLEKIRNKKIAALDTMSDEQYLAHYKELYYYFSKVEGNFGFDADLSKAALIEQFKQIDKETIYEMISAIPNEIIADGFYQQVKKIRSEMPSKGIKEKINYIWTSAQKEIDRLRGI